MAEVATNLTDFTSTGRTGRRNALPDILDVGTTVSSEELVIRLDNMAIDEKSDTASGGKESDGSQTTDGTSSKTEHCKDKSENEGS